MKALKILDSEEEDSLCCQYGHWFYHYEKKASFLNS